jgi:hypothetical protein
MHADHVQQAFPRLQQFAVALVSLQIYLRHMFRIAEDI